MELFLSINLLVNPEIDAIVKRLAGDATGATKSAPNDLSPFCVHQKDKN